MSLTLQDLLKPLKDVLLKNWSTSLAHVLDDFVNHLQQEHIAGLNFSEAAVVIQNSTHFYCKRLDHVFKLIEELTDNVNSLYAQFTSSRDLEFREHCKATEADCVSTPKRRRLADKVLESDDLDVLGLVISDHTIDLNIGRSKNLPLRNIVLNKDVKAVKKPNTAIPLCNSLGVFFGHKEDFRLGGKTWSDGTVNRDFHYSDSFNNMTIPMDVDHPMENGCDKDYSTTENNNNLSSPERLPSPCKLEEPSPAPEEPAQMLSPPPPMKQLSVKLKKIEDWERVTFKFEFPKVLKRRRAFSLPKELIEDAKKEMEKMEKRQKRAEKRASKLLETSQVQTEDSQDTGYVSETFDPPLHDGSIPSVLNATSGETSEVNGGGGDEMFEFKMKRRKSAQAAAEVAQRVSEWHEKMTPRLQEAEKRKKFNVHEYADVILAKFSDDDTKSYKPFAEIMAGEPWEEVSRYFLAMLCLANTYNVDIRRDSDAPNDFSVKLLSKVRHHKEMDRQVGNLN